MSWQEKNNMKTLGLIYGVLKNSLKAQDIYPINLRKPLQQLFLKKKKKKQLLELKVQVVKFLCH